MLITLVNLGVILIAVFHVWICILEMLLWQKPLGLKTFRLNPDFARETAPLAANQGLYNAFLSAGLFWSLLSDYPSEAFHLKLFFLGCVALAGIFGGITVNKRILFVQGMPAMVTFILLILSR